MTESAMHQINVRRLINHISNQISFTEGMSREDAIPYIEKYLSDLHEKRGLSEYSVGMGAVVTSFTVKDEKRSGRRGVTINGNDETGERIMHTFLRNRRIAKKLGRGLIGMVVVPMTITPIRPLQTISFTAEIKRG